MSTPAMAQLAQSTPAKPTNAEAKPLVLPPLLVPQVVPNSAQQAENFIATGVHPLEPAQYIRPQSSQGIAPPLYVDRYLSPTPVDQRYSYPAFMSARSLHGRNDESVYARGNAELRRSDNRFWAEALLYQPLIDEVLAQGNVRYEQGRDVFEGPFLKLQIGEQVGYMESPKYRISRLAAPFGWGANSGVVLAGLELNLPTSRVVEGNGSAKRFNFEGDNQVRIEEGDYTSCKPDERDWYAKANELYLDYDRSVGEGKKATLYFKDTPILYAPEMSFPLNGQRKSGFLAPLWGSSTRSGFDFDLPYYFNIAPNYDATLHTRLLTKRGLQFGLESRYLDPYANGTARIELLPTDTLYGDRRYAYTWQHNQISFGNGFSGTVNWNGVSDDKYWTDLSSRLVQTSQTHLTRQAVLNYASGSWWTVSSQLLRYQTLNPNPNVTITRPYFLEPQVTFNGRLPDLFRTDFTLFSQYTSFTHPTLVQGQRFVAYPQIALPLVQPGMFLTPKIGVHMTQYNLSQQTSDVPSTITRNVPIFSIDAGLIFERDVEWRGKAYTQTLEPRLFYVHTPYQDQSKIPVFDSGVADFNFAQIFSENRYVGNDRVSDSKQLTAAVTSRFIDPNTGGERFKGMLGQRFYYAEQQVVLPGESPRKAGASNLLAAFSGSVIPKTYVDVALEYDQAQRQTQRFATGLRYQPAPAKAVSVSYRMTRDQIKQIDIAAQWPISGRWYGVGRYNYSIRDKNLVEAIVGIEYKAGCWVSRFVAQRLQSVGGLPVTNFFYQLELNDFAQIGTNPIQLLRRSVPGYSRVNDATDDELLSRE